MEIWKLILQLHMNGILRDKEKAIPWVENFFIAVFQILSTNNTGDSFFRKASFFLAKIFPTKNAEKYKYELLLSFKATGLCNRKNTFSI